MTGLTRTARVVHAHPAKSYGAGQLLDLDGPDHARVLFDDGCLRLVRTDDLSLERALPLAVRRRERIVYPVEVRS